jgi:hypothetical protein
MAVRQLQYAQELEKNLAAGKSLQEAHDIAVTKGTVKPKAKSEPDIISRAWARLKAIFGGGGKTTRTKAIESGLKTAGLTDKEIARLQGPRK